MPSPNERFRCATKRANTITLMLTPKAEPFKQWLAKVGYERIKETIDPAQSIDRARENWLKLGRSEKWIQQRMTGQETRNKLTDYWKDAGVIENQEFAALTNIIHQEWTFTSGNSLGNPAACIYLREGEVLTETEMLDIAKQHKGFVSEVIYCTPKSENTFGLIYFSSECEVDFCGHGTIACMYMCCKNLLSLH